MYKTPEDFRRAFEIDLEVLVLDILKRAEAADFVRPDDADLKNTENSITVSAVEWPEGKSPFPGLRAFQKEDAPIFFGRGVETDSLVRQLTNSRFVAVVGASGSGKSSLVRAGLIPRLEGNAIPGSKDWRIAHFVPGEAPFEALYDALLDAFPQFKPNPMEARRIKQNFVADMREAPDTLANIIAAGLEGASTWAEVLLFIDQFEELFTLACADDARCFAEMLAALARSERVRVVATMRHDFFKRAVENQTLAEMLRADAVFSLAIPKRDALRQMIERPAERAGLMFDVGLIDRLLDDTGYEPGNLALTAYTLDELYAAQDEKRLTHAAYDRLGGVQGAIGTRAENTFIHHCIGSNTLQQVFHTLVEVDERGTATRRREQFQPDVLPDDMRKLIDAFTTARLLTADYDVQNRTATIEVAHEALLRSWPRLAEWIEATQDDLRLLRQVRNAVLEWDQKGRPPFLLWPQERLKLVYAMIERLKPELNEIEKAFIEPEQERLYRELQIIETSYERRRDIGDRLAVIGDTRPGGVIDGLPDITWLPVETAPDPVTIKTNRVEIGPVLIHPFFIAQYQITYPQFQTFLDADDGFADDRWWGGIPDEYKKQKIGQPRTKISNAPRDSISWYQCVVFTRWLNQRWLGLEFLHPIAGSLKVGGNVEIRLSTEWEWQWVAQKRGHIPGVNGKRAMRTPAKQA